MEIVQTCWGYYICPFLLGRRGRVVVQHIQEYTWLCGVQLSFLYVCDNGGAFQLEFQGFEYGLKYQGGR